MGSACSGSRSVKVHVTVGSGDGNGNSNTKGAKVDWMVGNEIIDAHPSNAKIGGGDVQGRAAKTVGGSMQGGEITRKRPANKGVGALLGVIQKNVFVLGNNSKKPERVDTEESDGRIFITGRGYVDASSISGNVPKIQAMKSEEREHVKTETGLIVEGSSSTKGVSSDRLGDDNLEGFHAPSSSARLGQMRNSENSRRAERKGKSTCSEISIFSSSSLGRLDKRSDLSIGGRRIEDKSVSVPSPDTEDCAHLHLPHRDVEGKTCLGQHMVDKLHEREPHTGKAEINQHTVKPHKNLKTRTDVKHTSYQPLMGLMCTCSSCTTPPKEKSLTERPASLSDDKVGSLGTDDDEMVDLPVFQMRRCKSDLHLPSYDYSWLKVQLSLPISLKRFIRISVQIIIMFF